MNHVPKLHIDGTWHAAYLIPGTTDEWSSVACCGTKLQAEQACRLLNAESERANCRSKQQRKLEGTFTEDLHHE